MQIQIVTSTGEGKTLLSAFDNALQNAGVSNYNLIVLSSIIPPESTIVRKKSYVTPPQEFGHRLYVVRAEMRSNETGKFIAAGVGWYLLDDGRGFFVEHELVGDTKVAVEYDIENRIRNSLSDMCAFRHIRFVKEKVQTAIAIKQVDGQPACALAVAVYRSEPW